MKEIIINFAIILLEMIAIALGIAVIVISFTVCDKDNFTLAAGCIIVIGYIALFSKTIYRIAYDKFYDDIADDLDEKDDEIDKLYIENNKLKDILDKKNKLINEYIIQYGVITDAE